MKQRIIKSKVFIAAGIVLLALTTLSFVHGVMAPGNSVTKINLNPRTPNILLNGQKVMIEFSYTTNEAAGVRIFARPFTAGSPSPSYAASPAPLSPMGSGTGTQNFTISTGNVKVDQIRFQMYNAAQTTVLFEAFIPVYYEFRTP